MARPMRSMRQSRRIKIYPQNCAFCETKTQPDYKETVVLGKYVTERGKIIPRSRSGLCSKHQLAVTVAIKQARFLALLPFVVRA